VILELKFSGRFPDWFKDLVRVFGLRQGSASKYADGIANQGEPYFYRSGTVFPRDYDFALAEERKRERRERMAGLMAGA
jgi:hypothetical protein